MTRWATFIFLTAFLLLYAEHVFTQDTIRYSGFVGGILLYESIELYSDSTFKWKSEYDLKWSETGNYIISNGKLYLNYFSGSGTNKPKEPTRTEIFYIEENKLYRLDDIGRRIKKLKDKSIKIKSGLHFGHKYKYEIRRVNL